MNILDIKFLDRSKNEKSLSEFAGDYYLVINTASKCGLTPQFDGLEAIHEEFKDKGLVTVGFPCGQFAGQELATAEEANEFCKLNYGVTFNIFDKLDVNGKNTAPIFAELKKQMPDEESEDIKWNFTKFLVGKDGNVIKRFGPKEEPQVIHDYLAQLIK